MAWHGLQWKQPILERQDIRAPALESAGKNKILLGGGNPAFSVLAKRLFYTLSPPYPRHPKPLQLFH
jgi:hypothetical protein